MACQILKKYELFSNEFVSNYAVLCEIRIMRTWSNARMGSAYRNVARVGRRVIDTHGYKCVYKFVFISVYSSILNQKPIMDAFWVICDLQNSAW